MAAAIKWPSVVRFLLLIILATLAYNTFYPPFNPDSTTRNFRRPKFNRPLTPQPKMASNFLKSIATRRSIYKLSKSSPISNQRIEEIVSETVKHSPSSFNSQSARAVILFGKEHDKLWDVAEDAVKDNLPPKAYEGLRPKLEGFKEAYGTVMWFEDTAALTGFKEKHPEMPFDQWSEHASGMVQVHTWTALELEGLGANLQHYNYVPGFAKEVLKTFSLPESWDLKSQLVFGTPTGAPKEKTFMPIDQRVKVFG